MWLFRFFARKRAWTAPNTHSSLFISAQARQENKSTSYWRPGKLPLGSLHNWQFHYRGQHGHNEPLRAHCSGHSRLQAGPLKRGPTKPARLGNMQSRRKIERRTETVDPILLEAIQLEYESASLQDLSPPVLFLLNPQSGNFTWQSGYPRPEQTNTGNPDGRIIRKVEFALRLECWDDDFRTAAAPAEASGQFRLIFGGIWWIPDRLYVYYWIRGTAPDYVWTSTSEAQKSTYQQLKNLSALSNAIFTIDGADAPTTYHARTLLLIPRISFQL